LKFVQRDDGNRSILPRKKPPAESSSKPGPKSHTASL
jgi:hypothetical protein